MMLRLSAWLLLSVAVSRTEPECDGNGVRSYRCSGYANECWSCFIRDQQITDNKLITITPKFANGTDTDVEHVSFYSGNITKMPKVIHKTSVKQVLEVKLESTKTRVLNAQFFENTCENLTDLNSYENHRLSLEASAFGSCSALKFLGLGFNGFSYISPDAFLGLRKLTRLGLERSGLSEINVGWFVLKTFNSAKVVCNPYFIQFHEEKT